MTMPNSREMRLELRKRSLGVSKCHLTNTYYQGKLDVNMKLPKDLAKFHRGKPTHLPCGCDIGKPHVVKCLLVQTRLMIDGECFQDRTGNFLSPEDADVGGPCYYADAIRRVDDEGQNFPTE